jgi:glycosyltransferase involved in cell wall biosynthesis
MITLNMIVRNEAALLPGCLKSVKDWVDAIHITDTGSTDDTVAIAESFGAAVSHFEWCDDFSAARNYALGHVNTEWTLWLDADDLVENPELLPQLIQQPYSGLWGIYKQDGSSQQRRMSLFKTKQWRWEGVVHESLVSTAGDNPTASCPLVVIHRKPPSRTLEAAKSYLAILLTKDPDNWFGIAESYRYLSFHPDDELRRDEYRSLAVGYYNKALSHLRINKPTRYICLINMAKLNLERVNQGKQWLDLATRCAAAAIKLDDTRAEGWALRGQCHYLLGQIANANEACEIAMRCDKPADGLFYYEYYDEFPKALIKHIKDAAHVPNLIKVAGVDF